MKSLSLLLVLGCICLAAANPHWTKAENEEVLDNYAVSFKIALKVQNRDTLESLYWEVSNPKSPFYGKFLSNEEIANLVSLPAEDIKKVQDFLEADAGKACNVHTRLGLHRDYIYVDTCAAQAKIIFPNLNLVVYHRVDNGHKILRSNVNMDIAYNMDLLGFPNELHQYVESIQDVTDLPVIATKIGDVNPINNPWLTTDKELTVKDMIKYFGIDFSLLKEDALKADHPQVRASVIELDESTFSPHELEVFQKRYGVPNNPIRKVIGGEEAGSQSLEAALDVQTLTSIAQGVQTWDFTFGPNLDFVPVVEKIMSTAGAPKISSLSYGMPETMLGKSKIDASDHALIKYGLGGYTFASAAGDSGPLLNPSDCQVFDSTYPGSSPYVLSVGGTALDSRTNVEHSWINGSGGFAVYQKRPAYQEEHVEHYLKTAKLPTNANGAKYNTGNRAYPDVSAFGALEPVLAYGEYQPIGGTSGSCPQFVAVLAMINVYRYQNDLGPLGAVNQALYQLKNGVGRDVTHGMNYATSRYGCSGQYLPGFQATEGWDASTGLGSPDFHTLIEGLGHLKNKHE